MILCAGLAGLCYRIRGGFGNELLRKLFKKPQEWEIPNAYIRLVWSLYIATIICLHTDEWLMFVPIAGFAYLGIFWGYMGKFDLGKPENRNWKNYALLTLDGIRIVLPLAVFMTTLLHPEYWLLLLAGVTFVPCYLCGNLMHRICSWQGHTQWGEWFVGTTIGAVLCLISSIL